MTKRPSLLSGEELLYTQDGIKTFSSRCAGKVSSAVAIPFFTKWVLFVTTRRIHFATTALSLFTIRKDFWFPDGNQENGRNVLKGVDGTGKLTLTVLAHNPLAPQRPVDVVMKFGFKQATQVAKLIQEQMETANNQVEPTSDSREYASDTCGSLGNVRNEKNDWGTSPSMAG